jgi:hypothetical protein
VDDKLRELERQWRATGSWEDEEAFVLARARETGVPLVRTDGLYLSRLEDPADARAAIPVYYLWLRFFPEGVAGVTTVPAEAELVGGWLALDHPHCSSGRWEREGAGVEFSQADHPGGVGYSMTHYVARARADGTLEVVERAGGEPRSYGFEPLSGSGAQAAG